MSTATREKKKKLLKKKVKEVTELSSDDAPEVPVAEETKDDKKKDFSWDEEYIVDIIEGVDRWGNSLIVKACRKGTKWYKDIRIHYIGKDDQLYHPTKKGFCIDDEFMDELEMIISKSIADIIKSHKK